MSTPELLRFRTRLDEALEEARRRGCFTARHYEALLVDPDFDDLEFGRFRERAERQGLALPEDGAESAPEEATPAPGEPERDLLDRYLSDIGRFPLLAHPDLM